uniref:Variant surface glycoprotein 402 n=1 Tax=Trypanosoma brucei TaxID=5691 RepID=M4TAB9_9TRYP|nr:variant surface glycoprotein 402 [Trypanosoma brucei]
MALLQSSGIRTAILIAVCGALSNRSAAHTSKHPLLATEIKPLCGLSGQLKTTALYVKQKLNQQATYTDSITQLARKLVVYSKTRTDDDDARIALALATEAQKLQEAATRKLLTMASKGTVLAVQAGLAAGIIDDFIALVAGVTPGGTTNNNCIINKDALSGTATFTTIAEQLPGCETTEIVTTEPPAKPILRGQDFTGFNNIKTLGNAATYSQTCCKLLQHASDADLTGAGYTGNKLLVAGGAIHVTSNNIQIAKLTDLSSSSEQSVFEHAQARQQEFNAAKPEDPATTHVALYTAALTSEAVKAATDIKLQKKRRTNQEINADSALESKVKGIIGSDADSFKNTYLDKVNKETIKLPKEWELELSYNKLENLETDAQYETILLYLSKVSQNNREQACTAVRQEQKQQGTDETCEKKGTEDNYKDGCKWDGEGDNKKCVKDLDYKPKQVEEKDDGIKEEKCAGKQQEDCKSMDCKWKGENYKYSSFLVDKKMALSMDTAFKGLVEFSNFKNLFSIL